MKDKEILKEFSKLCKEKGIAEEDVICKWLIDKLWANNYEIYRPSVIDFKEILKEEHDLIWDLQPTLEDDEEHAFAVQHIRDYINTILGRDLI